MQRSSVLRRLQEVAQEQWGLLTRRQIEKAGIGSTSLERLTAEGGLLERVANGVYRVIAAPIPDHLNLRAAWLQLATCRRGSVQPTRVSSPTGRRRRSTPWGISPLTATSSRSPSVARPDVETSAFTFDHCRTENGSVSGVSLSLDPLASLRTFSGIMRTLKPWPA